jgi:hypothetical protein
LSEYTQSVVGFKHAATFCGGAIALSVQEGGGLPTAALPKLVPSRMTIEEFLDWPGDGTGDKFDEPRAMVRANTIDSPESIGLAAP